MSERSTFLFFCLPTGSPAPTYADAKAKQISYDYFAGEYVVGEWVDEVSNFDYTFTVSGLRDQTQYDVYIWAENFYGNTVDDYVLYTLTTAADWPVKLSVGFTGSSASDITLFINALKSVIGVSTSRIETDLTAFTKTLTGSSAMNTTWNQTNASSSSYNSSEFNSSVYNKIVPVTNVSESTLPGPSSGTQVILAVFPPLTDLTEPACSDIASLINSNIGALDAAMGTGKLNVGYQASSTNFNPPDIRWIDLDKMIFTPGLNNINISGIRTNANATIFAVAYTMNRTIFPSTTYSINSAIRYLQQTSSTSSPGGDCSVTNYNELTVICDGTYSGPPDFTRTDNILEMVAGNASSYQVIHNADGLYFSADSYNNTVAGANQSTTIFLNNLNNGTQYMVFISAQDGYSKYPRRMYDQYMISVNVTTLSGSSSVFATKIEASLIIYAVIILCLFFS